MKRNKKLQREIRYRMNKTGERYCQARTAILSDLGGIEPLPGQPLHEPGVGLKPVKVIEQVKVHKRVDAVSTTKEPSIEENK